MASCQGIQHRRSCWTEWLPPPSRNEMYKMNGCHHRVTEFDTTVKDVNHTRERRGLVKDAYAAVLCWAEEEGFTSPDRSRLLVWRHSEEIELKYIDASSKFGHGRFQMTREKHELYGRLKQTSLVPLNLLLCLSITQPGTKSTHVFDDKPSTVLHTKPNHCAPQAGF
ncbi:unnamed protein product [Musa hybrid cultivar]